MPRRHLLIDVDPIASGRALARLVEYAHALLGTEPLHRPQQHHPRTEPQGVLGELARDLVGRVGENDFGAGRRAPFHQEVDSAGGTLEAVVSQIRWRTQCARWRALTIARGPQAGPQTVLGTRLSAGRAPPRAASRSNRPCDPERMALRQAARSSDEIGVADGHRAHRIRLSAIVHLVGS